MKFTQVSLVTAPLILTASAAEQNLHMVSERDLVNSNSAITVWNNEQTEVLGKSCTNSLADGAFAKHAISFFVSENGAGNVTNELIVNCVVPVKGLGADLKPLAKRSLRECFPDGPLEVAKAMDIFEGKVDGEIPSDVPSKVPKLSQKEIDDAVKKAGLSKRQCGQWFTRTRPVGNGNPHQNPLHIQLSEGIECNPSRQCTAGRSESRSFSIGWTANAAVSWISAGFSVVQTIETGASYECWGNPGDYLAVWKKQGQTAYTVQQGIYSPCTSSWQSVGGHVIIWSPNDQNKRGNYYCVYGRQYVRNIGDRWLDTSAGEPGGP
ncbi:Ff.00g054460.m01.CDS01 [Fusarium sp. VM40]|nr:Ff.00g054460.m01.CDS01 [Fusarium sp. VM40]